MKKLQSTPSTPAYFDDVRTACARIAFGMEHFTREEKHATYELLDLKLELTVEDNMKIAYAECVIDVDRLVVGPGKGGIASISSIRHMDRRR